MKNKVVMFEIPSSDFKKAKQFYETVFDCADPEGNVMALWEKARK
jgi:predicted enzyme related to lactoylglutathione lyase